MVQEMFFPSGSPLFARLSKVRTVTPATRDTRRPVAASQRNALVSQGLPWVPVAAILHFALLALGPSHLPSPQPQTDFGPAIEVAIIRTSTAEPHPGSVTGPPVPAISAAAALQPPASPQPKAGTAHSQIKPREHRPTAAVAKSPQQPPLAPSRLPRKQSTGDSSHAELPQPEAHQAVEPVSSLLATTASTVATASTATTPTVAKPRFPGKTARDTRSYLSQIAAWIDANKRYPTAAKKVKEEGVVLISFSIDRNGNLLASSIKDSSGHSRLDQSALATLARAAPFPPIPEFIDSDTLSIAVPIEYSLITD